MTTIYDCFLLIQFICNKQIASSPTPDEVSRALDQGQQLLYDKYVPLKLQGDELADNALIDFLKTTSLTSTSTGLIAYPSDFGSVDLIQIGNTSVTKVEANEIQDALQSVLYPISSYPRYREEKAGIQLYPKSEATVDMVYLISPTTPKVGVTVSGNSYLYDPNTSVQLGFASQYWNEIVLAALPYVGVSLKAPEVAALSHLFNQQQ